jgi:hypothetical protein
MRKVRLLIDNCWINKFFSINKIIMSLNNAGFFQLQNTIINLLLALT